MSGHLTAEKRRAESEKHREVAGSFRRKSAPETGTNEEARLQAQKRWDARREATLRGLMNATVAAIKSGNVTMDTESGHPYPNFVLIDGGLSGYVEGEPVVDTAIDGFSSVPETHEAIQDPNTYTVFCCNKTHAAAERLLDSRKR